jgi:hypothetical protein
LREHRGGTEVEEAGGEISPDSESRIPIGSARMRTTAANDSSGEGVAQLLNRKMLLDLRDTLRAFLTLLERR